ncbi:unnamed protein product [Cylicocyclus nassatus]|uniref:LITAF domain-containing protein n=1 Tax=Cylicocyclus nassatus TaxID=53992 RepID=A0AA36MB06_CYLNA|nr:unnamed protein product [Cylicocyclus nassatus]
MSHERERESNTSPPPTPAVPPRYVAFPPPQPHLVHTQGGVAYVAYPQPSLISDAPIVKVAPTFDPYPEYCPRCRVVVITSRVWDFGFCACIVLIVVLCMPPLWPLLILLCTHAVKDAHHYCPFCSTLLAIRKR